MRIIILGSGTLLSGPKRLPSAFLFESGPDKALFDIGPGILSRIHYLGIDVMDIKTIFLSHFHLDHCADVFPLLMNRFLVDPQANKDFSIIGPSDIEGWFNKNASTQGSWLHNCLPQVLPLQASDIIEWSGFNLKVFLNGHTATSISFRFDGTNSFFFSGDTGFNKEMIRFAAGCDSGFMECSYPDREKQTQHLTPSELGIFAQQAGFTRLIVNHMYPTNDTDDLKDRISKHFNGEVVIAEDMMVIR